jgi:hypothetical protein
VGGYDRGLATRFTIVLRPGPGRRPRTGAALRVRLERLMVRGRREAGPHPRSEGSP